VDLRSVRGRKPFAVAFVIVLVAAGAAVTRTVSAQTTPGLPFEVQSLSGSGNNQANPTWGQAGNNYSRVAAARYADGVGEPVDAAANPRFISNRVFNDTHQNLFSERNVTQWGFVWGQFLDHTFGLRLGRGPDDPVGEQAPIPFDQNDPVEEFENDLGVIPFERSARAPGTGQTTPRQQVNTVSSYIDAFAVYGPNNTRLEWLRQGPVDGNLVNNSGGLLLPDGYLPRGGDRPGVAIPEVELNGRLTGNPAQATIAGDIRSNENIGLTATHTLFAREHNRIVGQLPSSLTEQQKFEIARRVVIAEQQFITYNEWLPSLGVTMPAYRGYNPNVNTDLSNEFATVGYRAHSMIHGEFELEAELSDYTPAQLEALEELGAELAIDGDEIEIAVPLNLAFFNPDLLETLGLGNMLRGIGLEAQYNNDDQIDNQLRSVLFQIPVSSNPECLDGEELEECFDGVVDLAAIDIERGFDHGMPSYNQMRQAYGLPPVTSFTQITGESTDQFPAGLGINDPESLEFVELRDIDGNVIDPADEDAVEGEARVGIRATTLAARLRAIYGNVNNVDAFTGVFAEQHVPFADLGPLQLAIWTREFTRLRDGDRFFFGNQLQALSNIQGQYGIDFRTNLGDVIARNTGIPRDTMNENVFLVDDADAPTTCNVDIRVVSQGSLDSVAAIDITNTSSSTISGWSLNFRFPSGQTLLDSWNAQFSQSGPNVTVSVPANHWQGTLAPGQTATAWMRNSWDRAVNPAPTHFRLNGGRCTT
jgi:hypothetical protein